MVERVSTHVLDTTLGRPAAGIPVLLESIGEGGLGTAVGAGSTDTDGRVGQVNQEPLQPGEYRLVFSTAQYFSSVHGAVFYPRIAVHVLLTGQRGHVHIPVLASTFSYSTYLGS